MKKILLSILALLASAFAFGQHQWKAQVIDKQTKSPLANVTLSVSGTKVTAQTNDQGLVLLENVPDGIREITVSLVGYTVQRLKVVFPLMQTEPTIIALEMEEDELEAVVISSTRSTRSIKDIPTRVEFIAGEELEEKANMKSGDIRMVLSESTGIQTQQTSVTSANAAIRIQGLDGRYTQLLKDGFPLYAGAASGLGLLQIAPLDLKQVELVKGSASTLYGGGAIAGLVNLISKTPGIDRELNFHVDGTSALGLTLNGFYSKRNKKLGTTMFASYQNNAAYDPAGIDLSAIPKSERITFNPKLFFYPSERTTITLGMNSTFENRIGGDLHYIERENEANHTYFEQNRTQRLSTQFALDHAFGKCSHITVKNSWSYFNRKLSTPDYGFNGVQYASFTEANYASHGEQLEWIAGINLWTDEFKDEAKTFVSRNYSQTTIGAFVQNTWRVNNWLNIETGLRADHVAQYGTAFLPRISGLFKVSEKLTSRLGGGLGYKAPTIFTEDSERIQYRNVLPVSSAENKLEKSYGANWDVNYRTAFLNDRISFTINHLFFFTRLENPLQLMPQGSDYKFANSSGNVETKGTETNVKLGYEDFKLFLGYTYTDAHQHQNGMRTENPLTAKHRINAVLMYELEEKWKIGLEAYTFSKQLLNDGKWGKSYLITGLMAERLWERFSVYVNFENFTDTRQTRFDTVYTGTLANPNFRDIYAPMDGFIMNGGIKFRL